MKTYTISVEENANGTQTMNRKNDGFSALELLGVLEFTQSEIIDIMQGRIKPDFVVREVVKDAPKKAAKKSAAKKANESKAVPTKRKKP